MTQLKFNYKKGSKTPKGETKSIRIITKEHDAYNIYAEGLRLRKEKGLPFNRVLTIEEIEEAKRSLSKNTLKDLSQ